MLHDSGLGWAADHLDQLSELHSRWRHAVAGESLLHGDLRADQVLLDGDRVVFVDWPHACTGPPWADIIIMAPSIALQGGPPPDDVVLLSPQARGVKHDDLMAFAVAVAGGLLWYSTKQPPPGLPTVRQFQRAQGRVLLDWVCAKTRIASGS